MKPTEAHVMKPKKKCLGCGRIRELYILFCLDCLAEERAKLEASKQEFEKRLRKRGLT